MSTRYEPLSRRGFLAVSAFGALAAVAARGGLGRTQEPTPDLFAERRARLAALMKAAGITGVFVPPSANFLYLTGTNFGRSERIVALLLRADGAAALIAPAFEAISLPEIKGVGEVLT